MNREKEIHDKAIRLIEGGIVELDGLCFGMRHEAGLSDPCYVCELDCICHHGNAICDLCEECDSITGEGCFLFLVENYERN